MINIIVELDETKEPKELIDYLTRNHMTMHFCEECSYNIGGICQIHEITVLDEDFCSSAFPKINLSSLYGEFHENK